MQLERTPLSSVTRDAFVMYHIFLDCLNVTLSSRSPLLKPSDRTDVYKMGLQSACWRGPLLSFLLSYNKDS